jgi:5-methylcytosine-specific restriction enzyme A
MSRPLLRPCLARGCKNTVRGKPYCTDHQRAKDQAKRLKRPDLHNDSKERERRRRVVADHRAMVGDWCPGWQGRPAHSSADLVADHIREVGAGGSPYGPLVVRCRACNTARSMHIIRRFLTSQTTHDPSPGEVPITSNGGSDSGPVVS